MLHNFSYGAFGDGGRPQSFGYTGRWGGYTDERLGQVLNWHRWYGPSAGRWGSSDPIGVDGGFNVFTYAMNEPIRHFDRNGLERSPFALNPDCPPCEAAAQAAGAGVGSAWKVRHTWREARDLVNQLIRLGVFSLASIHNGAADAFRHCYWSCRMAQDVGVETALRIAGIHERCSPNDPAETSMDMNNNAVGARIPSAYQTDCRGRCLEASRNGQLQNSP